MPRRCPTCGALCSDWPCRCCELRSGRTQERIVMEKDLRGQSYKTGARKYYPQCLTCGRKLRVGEKNFCKRHERK